MNKPLLLIFFISVVNPCFAASYAEITWDTLVPQEARTLLRKTKPRYVDHSGDAATQEFSKGHLMLESSLSEKQVRMPGFVVPIDTDGSQVFSFFLVPYFGACIHVPPPPPNQLVFITATQGIEIDSINIPIWVEGTMSLDPTAHSLGYSGYKLTLDSYDIYDDY